MHLPTSVAKLEAEAPHARDGSPTATARVTTDGIKLKSSEIHHERERSQPTEELLAQINELTEKLNLLEQANLKIKDDRDYYKDKYQMAV
ncbi:unnamed protein product [Protopolystoma xenopodis]|uniref:Uncharacterized protein n=1 Tax=Protopolystoma xenopodis TaxID=117903 RepID=A0A448X207_9PLAT|nr:unnamed protein product [Protopolystoma xenopodis]